MAQAKEQFEKEAMEFIDKLVDNQEEAEKAVADKGIKAIFPSLEDQKSIMTVRERDYVLKRKLKYGVLDKASGELSLHFTQKSVADLLKVSRMTIYRGLPYENSQYVVYRIKMLH